MDYTAEERDSQESKYGERLKDDRYPWRIRHIGSRRLAKIYDKAGMYAYAERARTCATWLQYTGTGDQKELQAANFCQLRLCPMCIGRRARRAAYKLSQVLDLTEREHKVKFIFLTLTIRNCAGKDLSETITQLLKGWYRLMDNRKVERAVQGWFRALEITRNEKNGTYHPHLHVILAVEPGYFDRDFRLYIEHKEWVERWAKALRVDYRPGVWVEITRGKESKQLDASAASAKEAAKYCVKDEDYISPTLSLRKAANIVTTYTEALHRRRLTAYGGWLLEAARLVGAEDLDNGDLVHVDEERLRLDMAELIEDYHWNLGAGDYILSSRRPNPNKSQ